jgi:hypothetical protein
MVHDLSAEHIASALHKGRQIGPDRWQACCPAHDDKSPSFTITQKADRVLFHCFAGCSQAEVISALRSRGLWPEAHKKSRPVADMAAHKLMLKARVRAYEQDRRRGIPPTTKERRCYQRASGMLASPFTGGELVEMHLWCLLYKVDRHYGRPSTRNDDLQFMTFSRVVYEKGVPLEW